MRVIVPPHEPPVSAPSVPETTPEPSQLSVHDKSTIAGTSPEHSTVTSAGGAENTGSVVSSIVIICVVVATLPHSSVMVYVRVSVMGQLPTITSEFVTIKSLSIVTSSLIINGSDRSPSPSSSAIVVAAAGASAAEQPSIADDVKDPKTAGGSSTITSMIPPTEHPPKDEVYS